MHRYRKISKLLPWPSKTHRFDEKQLCSQQTQCDLLLLVVQMRHRKESKELS